MPGNIPLLQEWSQSGRSRTGSSHFAHPGLPSEKGAGRLYKLGRRGPEDGPMVPYGTTQDQSSIASSTTSVDNCPMTSSPWQRRIQRAQELAGQYPFTAEIL